MVLPLPDLERYARQIILPEIGEARQDKLLCSSVLVIGAGGLGSPVAYYLAAAGVGRLGILDRDQVDLSNLNRQILHFTSDLGRFKVESAKDKLTALNPGIRIEPLKCVLKPDNARSVISNYDLCVIAVDDIPTRYLVNEACYQEGKPFVEGAVSGFFGHITTFIPPRGPCYRCLFQESQALDPVQPHPEKFDRRGVIGVTPGIIGVLQAAEALKLIMGIGELLIGRLLVVDLLKCEFVELIYSQRPECPVCGGNSQSG